MNVETAYKFWSEQYDTNENKTRDLEGLSLRETLQDIAFNNCLEIGCGTGKNTLWLEQKADIITAVDLTQEMIDKAKTKIQTNKVHFVKADITKPWSFLTIKYQLATFSLVLEHIENLDPIFEQLALSIEQGGYLYIGELHPFKQYAGSKARFMTDEGEQVVNCFNHNISDFTKAAKKFGFAIELVNEYFDDNDRNNIPRILTLLFRKV